MANSAIISPCGKYRYRLTRGGDKPLPFVMLNPSTADASTDDATIRRCMGFARREMHDGIIVCNLFAYRSTNPKALCGMPKEEAIGPENFYHLDALSREHKRIVVAWGNNSPELMHEINVARLLRSFGARLVCFGVTRQGSPRHPLYIAETAPLVEFSR